MKRIKITTESEIEGFSGDFATVEVESKEELNMDNCRNVVAVEVAKKAFETNQKQKQGMWVAEVV